MIASWLRRSLRAPSLIAACGLAATPAAGSPVRAAIATGPIPVDGRHGQPFRGAGDSGPPTPARLAALGYVEEEYFVSGRIEAGAYRTAILVRKPRDPARFSGVVVVEPVHIAGGLTLWAYDDIIAAEGAAYVAVLSQRLVLERIVKPPNPMRYASLRIPSLPVPPGPQPPAFPGAPPDLAAVLDTAQRELPVNHAILSAVGAMLKANPTAGPFRGERVRYLILGGTSQTGALTLDYIEHAAAAARLRNGSPIYDGFFPVASGGRAPLGRHSGRVIQIMGEGDLLNYRWGPGLPYRRPDGDSPGDRYRLYEVAGAAHVSTRGVAHPERRVGLKEPLGPGERASQFPETMIYGTALHNLIRWVKDGIEPPHAARIELDADGHIRRDSFGNALGGVRSSYLDVPVARYIAAVPGAQTDFSRQFIGLEVHLPRSELARLYPSHAAYVARVEADLASMTREGWLLPAYAEQLKQEALASSVP